MGDIKEQIRTFILGEFLPGEKAENLTDTTELISSGIVDSLATLRLVSYLEEQFGISVAAHEMVPENLNSVLQIEQFVQSKSV